MALQDDDSAPAAAEARRPGRPVSLEKRQALLDAAIDEFTEHGYDHASMDAVAARAEVSKRTLYNHFQSKEGLFAALVDEVARRISLSASIAYRPDEPLGTQLLRYANESRRLMSRPANLRLLRAVLVEHIRHPQRVEPVLEKYWRTEYGFTDWVAAAQRDGRLQGDPVRLGQVMSSMMKSVIFWPTVLGRGTPSHRETDAAMADAIAMFLQFYGAARRDR